MMDCKKLREVLDAYIDCELSPDSARQAEGHIAECESCRQAVEGLRGLRAAVRVAAGEPEAPAHVAQRIQKALRPKWYGTQAIQAMAAALVLVAALTLFVPAVRGAAATALDFLSLTLDDSRPVVLEGQLLCRDCQLEKQYGYHAMCPLTGHHGAIVTADGRIWNILEGEKSRELIHNSSLLGRRVRIEGRMYRKAGSIAVSDYRML
jgi:hypothetical protein